MAKTSVRIFHDDKEFILLIIVIIMKNNLYCSILPDQFKVGITDGNTISESN